MNHSEGSLVRNLPFILVVIAMCIFAIFAYYVISVIYCLEQITRLPISDYLFPSELRHSGWQVAVIGTIVLVLAIVIHLPVFLWGIFAFIVAIGGFFMVAIHTQCHHANSS